MRAAVPEMRIHALQVKRAFYKSRENLVVRQIWRIPPQEFQIAVGNFVLDLVPVLRTFLQLVRLPPDHFDGVHSRGGARRVGDAAANDLHRRIVQIYDAPRVVLPGTESPVRRSYDD